MSEILLLTISTAEPTKRGILGKVAKIYDPLGLASPVTLSGKMLYRDACDTKIAWDRPLPSDLQAKWKKWEQGLPEHVNAPRNVVKHVGTGRGKEHSNGQYNTFTHWSCPAIGRM